MNATQNTKRQTPAAPARNEPAFEVRPSQRPFDYGVSYGNRCGYSNGRRYSDLPDRSLFHCG
jgi:hypothetical protein